MTTSLVILGQSIVSTTSLPSIDCFSSSNLALPPAHSFCGPSICPSPYRWSGHQRDRVLYTTHSGWTGLQQETQGTSFLIIMSGVSPLPSKMPHLHPLSTMPNFSVSSVSSDPVTTLLPQEETAIQAHTIVIVVIFCAVCLLLLLAFLYTFCFHCSIQTPPKDQRSNGFSLDREDATYKGSSSECPSVANVV